MITGKIDVRKIDKSKLYEGKKGLYLDIVLIETPNSEFGDFMICQSTTKEERLNGVKGMILGNAKRVGSSAAPRQAQSQPQEGPDGVPF